MKAENLLQSKLDKVKSFIDNESFVFTFPKTNAFAIHKDQLFKNQLYNTTIGPNGLEINTRKSSDVIKNEKIVQMEMENGLILFDSGRLISYDFIYEPSIITAPDTIVNINDKELVLKNKIKKFVYFSDKLYILTNTNKVFKYDQGKENIYSLSLK